MLLLEPYLTNVDPTTMPRPWVKWAYQPVRAQDVPAAFMRAIATALQPPAGPVFLSLLSLCTLYVAVVARYVASPKIQLMARRILPGPSPS